MNSKKKLLGLMLGCMVLGATAVYGETVVVSTNIYAWGYKILATPLLEIKACEGWDNTPYSVTTSTMIEWGQQPEDCASWVKPTKFLRLKAKANYQSWNVVVFTTNTLLDVSISSGNGQRGGLVESAYYNDGINTQHIISSNCAKVALGWAVSGSSLSATTVNYSTGTPGEVSQGWVNVRGSTATITQSWTHLKDRGDVDDLSIPTDQTWALGYAGVTYGGGNWQKLCYGLEVIKWDYLFVLFEGNWGASSGGKTYKGKIYFDLFPQ